VIQNLEAAQRMARAAQGAAIMWISTCSVLVRQAKPG